MNIGDKVWVCIDKAVVSGRIIDIWKSNLTDKEEYLVQTPECNIVVTFEQLWTLNKKPFMYGRPIT